MWYNPAHFFFIRAGLETLPSEFHLLFALSFGSRLTLPLFSERSISRKGENVENYFQFILKITFWDFPDAKIAASSRPLKVAVSYTLVLEYILTSNLPSICEILANMVSFSSCGLFDERCIQDYFTSFSQLSSRYVMISSRTCPSLPS